MAFQFKKATKAQSRARISFIGVSGSGKTMSALIVAIFLGKRVAVIDSERGSASKYAGKKMADGTTLDFDVLELESFSPRTYVEAMRAAAEAGYDVIVIDSLSHAWMGKDGALEMVDNAQRANRGGNSFTAWRNVTPEHNALVDAMLQSPCHIIATMRAKTEYVLEEDGKGKKVPRKIGMAPVQRDGLEYEFDVVGDIDLDHVLTISKSRCDEIADKAFRKPGRQFAETLKAWLSDGTPAVTQPPQPAPQPPAVIAEQAQRVANAAARPVDLSAVESAPDHHALLDVCGRLKAEHGQSPELVAAYKKRASELENGAAA